MNGFANRMAFRSFTAHRASPGRGCQRLRTQQAQTALRPLLAHSNKPQHHAQTVISQMHMQTQRGMERKERAPLGRFSASVRRSSSIALLIIRKKQGGQKHYRAGKLVPTPESASPATQPEHANETPRKPQPAASAIEANSHPANPQGSTESEAAVARDETLTGRAGAWPRRAARGAAASAPRGGAAEPA